MSRYFGHIGVVMLLLRITGDNKSADLSVYASTSYPIGLLYTPQKANVLVLFSGVPFGEVINCASAFLSYKSARRQPK